MNNLAQNGLASSGSTDSFSPSTPTGKLSVMQRARALEQRAAAGQQTAMSPQISPPPYSPFVKNTTMAAQMNTHQFPPHQSPTAPSDGGDTPGDSADEAESIDRQPSEPTIEEDITETAQQQQSERPTNENGKPPSGPDYPSEEDQDETPRQSTNYSSTQKRITRQDSSRQANYSLKPQAYSPDSRVLGHQAEPVAPPRLPKLFFEGGQSKVSSLNQNDDGPSYPSSPGIRSSQEELRVEEGGDVLAVADLKSDGQIIDTPSVSQKMDASNRTFFWHSPHDSTDETDEEDYVDVRPPATNRQNTLTSATALGFGGPSDWEHFYGGDYQTTELIDDTELYLSKKERNKQETDESSTFEGRATTTSEESTDFAGTTSMGDQRAATDSRSRETLPLPTIEEARECEESNIVPQHIDYEFSFDSFARSPPPVTPAIPPTPSVPVANNPKYSPGLESSEYISIEGKRPSDETVVGHKISQETITEAGDDDGEEGQHVGLEDERTGKHGKEEVLIISENPSNRPSSRTPPPSEIKLPRKETTSSVGLTSGPSSPPADDPNASEITISMVMPPDFDTSFLPQEDTGAAKASPPLRVVDSRKSVFPQSEEQPNPYAGLSSMTKASLNRFIRMLREEEKAGSDQDKYYIFTNFARHEMKLRATLYDMDDESELSIPPSARASLMSTPNRRKTHSPSTARRKPLPVPPEDILPMDPTTGRAQSMLASAAGIQPGETEDKYSEVLTKNSTNKSDELQQKPSGLAGDSKESQSESTKDETRDSDQNSEEGRSVVHQSSLEILNKSVDLVAPRTSMISDPNTASPLADPLKKSFNERQSTTSSPLPGAQILEVSLSVKSSESRPYDGDKATNRQSIYRPFSGALRSSSSYRRASMESLATVKSSDKTPERKGTDPNSLAHGQKAPVASVSSRSINSSASRSGRQPTSIDSLSAVIPQNNVLREEHRQLASLRFDMDNIVDDFSFIHKTVLAWDSGAKIKRERYELERQKRMSENERRVEELFNDHEIGYGDINHIEDDFKRSESAKKADEEREEVESFVSSVFDVVWARINYEMDRLTPLYQDATKLVAQASAGKQMFEDTDERVPIAPIMEILLILYQKLMIRHQKAFEAVLERDRRLKKTEVSPWFAVGAFDKVKRIEKRFEDAEKKAILEFCRQRDERANLLMDVLDQHTLRGVGANQDYMESVMQVVRRIAVQTAIRSDADKTEDTKTSLDEVAKAKLVTVALARSSEQIVRNFHVADMLLNAADYEVSVANAKLSNADAAAFKRLRDAKAKEDAKLAADLEHRLGLIRSDTSRTKEEIAKLVILLGQEDPEYQFDLSKERDKRMLAALVEAKARLNMPPPPPEK